MMADYVIEQGKITAEHQSKSAFVYVRQSTLSQVNKHAESTELQYRLVERAAQLGWPPDQVHVVDEDLGKSGTSADNRSGFQRLLAEIGLARVGLVLSFDASRLARNNRDWYQLLELCALFGTLIGDSQSVYDPRQYHDRLLLGLSGIMSEAELHQIKLRMHTGLRQKAERGELPLPLPAGLARLPTGEVVLNPDEEIQARIRFVLTKFRELGTARRVERYLRKQQLRIPVRPLAGPQPHEVFWRQATSSRVLAILKNPAYAGAYVYGKKKVDPARRSPGHPYSGRVHLPIDQWQIVLHDRYPAYISWQEYLENQNTLQANVNNFMQQNPGAPNKGKALVQGLARCGRCSRRMQVRYTGPQGNFPVYRCGYISDLQVDGYCQEVRALGLDGVIEQCILEALEPDKVAMALQAVDELEQEQGMLHKQWQLRLERAHYEAQRAQRQYDQVEPENRLVARTLEKRWEEKLRTVEKIEQEYQEWQARHPIHLTEKDRTAILALAQDLPRLWQAPATTIIEKKQIVRLLVRDILVDQTRVPGKVWYQINWQTGAVRDGWYQRRVNAMLRMPTWRPSRHAFDSYMLSKS